MEDVGKFVEYVLYKDEGYGFVCLENCLYFYGIVEEFLVKYLGGKFELVGFIEGYFGLVR